MKNQAAILTPLQREAFKTITRCAEMGYPTAITGPSGSGVTTLCSKLANLWRDGGRVAFEMTVYTDQSLASLLQHMASQLLGDEMPSDWGLHSPNHLISRISDSLQKHHVGLLVIDRADNAPREFLDAILTMCEDSQIHMGVLLGWRAGGENYDFFRGLNDQRITKVLTIHPLEEGEIASILPLLDSELENHLKPVSDAYFNNELEAILAVRKLHSLSEGLFRPLHRFLELAAEKLTGNFTAESVASAWEDIMYPIPHARR